MSRDEVHDAVAQYEGCSSIKVFATVEEMKPAVGQELSHSNLRILQSDTEVEVASFAESRGDIIDNQSRGDEANGAESREDADASNPCTADRRLKKMLPRRTASKVAKKSMAIQQKLTHQSPGKPSSSPPSDLAAVHAIR
jgi:hypothetical protein